MGIFSVIPHGESNGGFGVYGRGRVENTVRHKVGEHQRHMGGTVSS